MTASTLSDRNVYDEETRGRLESLTALYKYSHQSGNESARQNVKLKTVNQKPCSVITFKAVNEVYPNIPSVIS